jgi:hypothetical protein
MTRKRRTKVAKSKMNAFGTKMVFETIDDSNSINWNKFRKALRKFMVSMNLNNTETSFVEIETQEQLDHFCD